VLTRLCLVATAALVAAGALAPAAQAGAVRAPPDRTRPALGHITVRYAVLERSRMGVFGTAGRCYS